MFSKPIPKLPEPTLPRSSSTAAQCELPDTGRLELKRGESVECRAFQKCFADLAGASGILNPGWLAVQLYSRELIGTDLLKESQKPSIEERVKIVKLLSAVEDQILASPAIKFREFLDVLQNEPSLQHLVTGLENTHHELSGLGMSTPSMPPLMSIPSNQPCTTCTQPSPCPHHLPPMSVDANSFPPVPPAKRPRTDNILQPQYPLEHTLQPFDIQHDHKTSVGYPREHTAQSTTPYSSGGQSSAVDTYASYLKSVYAREKLLSYDKWPLVKSRKYINLALIEKDYITKPEAELFMKATIHGNIDDIKKSKRAMCISQIGQLPDGSHLKCILVEGAPGVGKSTFAWKLCHRWGKGTLLKQYRLVVLLRLRDKSVRAAKNTSDLFRYHRRHIQQVAVDEIQDTGGKEVLILFEGYDELTEELRTQNSIFLDIITGRELPEATVLITSRPWASEFLHRECKEHISQHVEILGFTKANIQSYLESTTANEPSLLVGLMKYISCYPHIGSLMYIPLNSAIVVEVYRNSKKDETLVPKTMTELYSSLVRSLLLRHLLDHPVHGKQRKWRVRGFSDLPQDVYQQLCELGRIAYEGILHGQQVIFSDLQEDLETLSLMQCAPELYVDEGAAVSYNFLHLTVQEYLAAFHLSLQPVEEQIKHFRELCNGERKRKQVNSHFHMVMRFLSGLRKFSGYLSEVINMFVKKPSDDSVTDVHGVTFDTLQWLFEAQDNDVIAELLGSSNIQPDRPYDSVALFDCFVLGYCVSHSNCTWRIVLKFCYIGDEGVEMIMRGAVEEETHCIGGISEMDLSGNEMTSEGVKTLSSFPAQLINKLELLNLNDNDFDSGSCAALTHLIPRVPHLKVLDLSDNLNIGQGGAVPLIASLSAHNSLEQLLLLSTGIGVEDCQALSELLSLSTSLKVLATAFHHQGPEAVELIISGLHRNISLKTLIMRGSHFSIQNTISLASVLRTNHILDDLNLNQCKIDSDGACQLASALCTNDTLEKLNLGDNPIEDKGAAAFAEMLLKNTSLKYLWLQDGSISEKGAQKLIESLTHNTTVETLWLPFTYLHGKYKSLIAMHGLDRRVAS